MRSIPHVAFGSVVSTCTVESGSTKSTRGSAVMLFSAPARNVRGIALRGVRVDEADGEPQSARVLARDRGRIRVVVQDDDVAGRSGAPCRRGGNEQDREECDDGKKGDACSGLLGSVAAGSVIAAGAACCYPEVAFYSLQLGNAALIGPTSGGAPGARSAPCTARRSCATSRPRAAEVLPRRRSHAPAPATSRRE